MTHRTTLGALQACLCCLLLAGCAIGGDRARGQAVVHHPEGENIIGRQEIVQATRDDTLIDLARSHNLGYVELAAANPGVDPWLPGEGTRLVLPTAHLLPPGEQKGIVINLAEQRLYYFDDPAGPMSFPIGVGREGADTPLGETTVVRKREDPTWYPPASARREDPSLPSSVPPGPENPLGDRALYLGWPAYLVHGTNEPYGIGRRVSRGCIRLYPEDIRLLYPMVAKGTPVRVIDEPLKIQEVEGELYLEAHPSLQQASQIEEDGSFEPEELPELRARLIAQSGLAASRLDWLAIDKALASRTGVPVRITRSAHASAAPEPESETASWSPNRLLNSLGDQLEDAWSDLTGSDDSASAQ